MSKSVAKKEDQLPLFTEDQPSYIKEGNRGNENVEAADMIVPRIEIAQALSPCLNEDDATHIPGIKQGLMYNTVTRELYGESLYFVPILFFKEWLLWRDRQKGGGFGGAYPDMQSAATAKDEMEDSADWEAIDTGQHLVLVLGADGKPHEAMLSLAKSKMKVSRALNSMARLSGTDRFARIYELKCKKETNNKNQEYWNFTIRQLGFPRQEVYEAAQRLYFDVSSGKTTIEADRSDESTQEPTEY